MWARVEAVLRMVRGVAGMPDYVAYVEHVQRCHPDQVVPDERAFYEQFLRTRYEGGPTRCC